MILGLLSGLDQQRQVLPPAIVRALEAFQAQSMAGKPPGRYEIEGDKLFCLVQDAKPRAVADCLSEAHHRHADIQIPISTRERFGFALPQTGLAPCDDQIESRDLAFYPTPANEFFMDVEPGSYVVFLPTELHRPCVLIEDKSGFRKAVIKVHASLLGL
jgi:biofilm protein TabA